MESYVVILSLSVVLCLSQYYFYTLLFHSQNTINNDLQLVFVSFEFDLTQDIVGKVRLVVTSKQNPI